MTFSFKIEVEITGQTPLLMHRFNIEEYESKVKDKNLTPRQQAEKFVYQEKGGRLYLPSDNIYSAIMNAGKMHKDGKSKITTAKSSKVPWGLRMGSEKSYFSQPNDWAVDSRAVRSPTTGVRVLCHRPRLEEWILGFSLLLDTTIFSANTIKTLVIDAGSKVGLCAFRPECKGMYGTFMITKWKEV